MFRETDQNGFGVLQMSCSISVALKDEHVLYVFAMPDFGVDEVGRWDVLGMPECGNSSAVLCIMLYCTVLLCSAIITAVLLYMHIIA